MAETQAAGRRKELIGHVVSNRMKKTIVVQVIRKKSHPLYTRVIAKAKKFYAHDENNEAHIGDVGLEECQSSKVVRAVPWHRAQPGVQQVVAFIEQASVMRGYRLDGFCARVLESSPVGAV